MMEGPDPDLDLDPYKMKCPNPGGLKTYGSRSTTLCCTLLIVLFAVNTYVFTKIVATFTKYVCMFLIDAILQAACLGG
jgi:hypothetical protein